MVLGVCEHTYSDTLLVGLSLETEYYQLEISIFRILGIK